MILPNWKISFVKVPETPRRKRGAGTDKEYGQKGVADTSADAPETPGEAIVKRLTNERIQVIDVKRRRFIVKGIYVILNEIRVQS